MIKELDEKTFKEKVFNFGPKSKEFIFEGEKPSIVEFSASWCKPCKSLEPVLEELSEEYKDEINIYKVNVEDESNIAIKLGIKAIPSLLFISLDKKTPQMTQGNIPKEQLKSSIDNVLLKKETKETKETEENKKS